MCYMVSHGNAWATVWDTSVKAINTYKHPNFRSFPEFIDSSRLYTPFDVDSALQVLGNTLSAPKTHPHIVELSDLGRQMEAYIVVNDIDAEINIWHEYQYGKHLLQGK